MEAYKGFDKDLKCREFQYEIGGEYEEPKASMCVCGFHACEDPIDVLGYYPPASSRYCKVELDNVTGQRVEDDTKICGSKIKIGAEIGIPGIIKAHIEYVKKNVREKVEKGEAEAATAGNYGAATAGNYGAATAGYRGAATAGESGAATAGESGAATAGYRGAATAGESGAATSRGSVCVGENGAALARGNGVKAKGGIGSVLVLVEEQIYNNDIRYWKAVVVDGEVIEADTWYTLNKDGEVVKCEENQG